MSTSAAVFTSGAKSSEEKPRYDLIPFCALEREANRMSEGARAHGENNYQAGKDDPAFIRDRVNHMIAHALKYASGDRSDDHLAAVRANAGMLMWFEAQTHMPEVGMILPEVGPEHVGQSGWVIPEAEKMRP